MIVNIATVPQYDKMSGMKGFVLRIVAAFVSAAAAVIRFFVSQKDEILLISCQSDEPSLDILDLAAAIEENQATVNVMAGRVDRSVGGAFSFIGRLFSMLKKIAAAKVVVLDAYCPAVSIPKKRADKKVVQIWHAPDAIKKFSLQIADTPAGYDSLTIKILKMHKNYDFILCPAEATLPFFEAAFGYPESAFVKYGLPSLDRLGNIKPCLAMQEKYPELAMTGESAGSEHPLTVVYAPTFRDGTEIDTAGLITALEKAMPGLIIVLKLHPLDAFKNAMSSANTDGVLDKDESCVIVDSSFPLIDWYSVADIIVTDYSGAAIEAAAAGVASYYYIYDFDEYNKRRGLNIDLRDEAVGKYAFKDAANLAEQMARDFAYGSDVGYDFGALSKFKDKYLEVPLTGNTQKLASFVCGLSFGAPL